MTGFDGVGVSPKIGADVVLEFEKSIQNIKEFAEQMENLDSKFGSLDRRVDNLRTSLSDFQSQTSKRIGNKLRATLQAELEDLIQANGITLSAIGNAPIQIKQQTVRHLFGRVEAELNRAILQQIGSINVKIDPNYNNGVIPIGKDEFDELNKEIARLVKVQTKNLVDSIRKNGTSLLSEDDLKGLKLEVGKGTVNNILANVKEQLLPILLNPKVAETDATIKLTKKDLERMLGVVKEKIKQSLEFDFDGVLKQDINADEEMLKTARAIDNAVLRYINEMRRGISSIDPRKQTVAFTSLTKRLQKYISDNFNATEQQMIRDLGNKIDVGSANAYELKRQFSSLERVVNNKLFAGTSKMMTELKRNVREVEITTSPELKHHLIREINKLNNDIVKKIREQIDNQFAHMRAEVQTINTDPRNINRNGRIRNMSSMAGRGGGSSSTTIINNYNNDNRRVTDTSVADPYARRDNYFNKFGLEGAVINTVRHILAGGLVGMPMMAAYDAMDTFKTVQMEMQKIFQNYMLKDDYKIVDEDGNKTTQINFDAVQADVNALIPKLKELGQLYAIRYDQIAQVGAVASRLTDNPLEARQFVDMASMIYRLDNEGDLVGTIAPGLEAIMGQFGKSVWEMGDAVKAFAVAANTTKATTDEIMKGLQRSGSAFKVAGMDEQQAIAALALTIQNTGLTGENVGNYYKTLLDRLGRLTTEDKLAKYGIDVYKEDEYGVKVRRNADEILTEIANKKVSGRLSDEALNDIIGVAAGGYHNTKLLASIDYFSDKELDSQKQQNYHNIMKQIREISDEDLFTIMTQATSANAVNMERAGVSVNLALTSIIESLAPSINHLASVIVSASDFVRENSNAIGNLINMIATALVGGASMYGFKRLGQWGGYEGHVARNETLMELTGGRRLLSRREVDGVFSNPSEFVNSRELRSRLQNRKFLDLALQNSAIEPYLTAISQLEGERREQFQDFLRRNPVNSMEELLMAVQDFETERPRRQLDDDEVYHRSRYNLSAMRENKAMSRLMADEFAQELMDTLSDRDRFNELTRTEQGRGTLSNLANMDESGRRDFIQFLELDYQNTGRQIRDFNDLSDALARYQRHQVEVRQELRRTSPEFENMSNALKDIDNSMKQVGRNRGTFLDFLDKLETKGRGAGGAIMTIARNIGGMVKQVGLMLAIGEVVTGLAERPFIDERQERLINAQTDVDTTHKLGEWYRANFIESVGMFLGGLWNDLTDFGKGNQKIGFLTDIVGRDFEYRNWIRENYGIGEYLKSFFGKGVMVDEETLNKFNEEKGYTAELNAAKRDKFMEDYAKAAVEMDEQQRLREVAEKARQDLKNKLFDEDNWGELTADDIIEQVNRQIQELDFSNALEEVNALLGGLQRHSQEYIELRKQAMLAEADLYMKWIDEITAEKEALEQKKKELEDSGKDKTTNDEGEEVNTEEYEDVLDDLAKYDSIHERIKDFELKAKQKQLEAMEWAMQQQMSLIDRNFRMAKVNMDIQSAYNAYNMDRNSAEYIDSQISDNASERALLQQKQAELQELLEKTQAEGGQTGTIEEELKNVAKEIANTYVALKDLKLQQVTVYKEGMQIADEEQEIAYLEEKLRYGNPDDDSPIMKQIRIAQANEDLARYSDELARKQQELASTEDAEIRKAIEREMRDLQKRSLQTQLSILDEIKQNNGTFNLPDGVKPMTELDYMLSKGTHRQFTVQQGNMYMQVILPNVTGDKQTAVDAGFSLGQGIVKGIAGQTRLQLNSNPWGYAKNGF